MPDLERVREIAIMLSVADPQGHTLRGTDPMPAYGVEAYSLALLEEQHGTLTPAMVTGVFDFWYNPRAGWATAGNREMTTFVSTVFSTRPLIEDSEIVYG